MNSSFTQLIIQIKQYIDNNDTDSLQYLLDRQYQDKIQKIKQQLNQSQLIYFQNLLSKVNILKKTINYGERQHNDLSGRKQLEGNQQKIKLNIQDQQEEEDEGLEIQQIQKQYKLTGITYGQNYSYPYINLLQKMCSIYFSKHNNPLSFPQLSLKMLHSQIQTLFMCIFNQKFKEYLMKKKQKTKKGYINHVKEYLFYIFEKQYIKFYNFTKIYQGIRKTIENKTESINNQDNNNNKVLYDNTNNISALTSSNNLQQIEYFSQISQQIKNQIQFKQYTKIKSLNFLYFGQKKLKNLIDSNNIILSETMNIPKQLFQLISFIICRFLRNIIISCIRRKNKQNKLRFLKFNQQIQSIQVKIVGNQIIQKCKQKAIKFMNLDQPIEEIAKRTFVKEFYQFDYEAVIPGKVIEQGQKEVQKNRRKKEQCGRKQQGKSNDNSINNSINNSKDQSISLAQQIWNNCKQYRVLWTQRITAQQYINLNMSINEDKTQKKSNKSYISTKKQQNIKPNQYSKFIMKNFNEYQKNHSIYWLKYFTMRHLQYQNTINDQINKNNQYQIISNIQNKQIKNMDNDIDGNRLEQMNKKGRKKIKLQSLND